MDKEMNKNLSLLSPMVNTQHCPAQPHLRSLMGRLIRVSVAQWLEQRTHNASVLGSSPSRHTILLAATAALHSQPVTYPFRLAFFW